MTDEERFVFVDKLVGKTLKDFQDEIVKADLGMFEGIKALSVLGARSGALIYNQATTHSKQYKKAKACGRAGLSWIINQAELFKEELDD